MIAYDPDAPLNADADLFDFDTRDAIEARRSDIRSAMLTGFPERPGCHRAVDGARVDSIADAHVADDFDDSPEWTI